MNIYKLNRFRFSRNNFLQKFIRVLLIFSLLYLSTAEIFASNELILNNCKNDYILSTTQNYFEINLNEGNQRTKLIDQYQFSIDKSAITTDHCFSLYTEYFVNFRTYSVHLFYLTYISNYSLRAPPSNYFLPILC